MHSQSYFPGPRHLTPAAATTTTTTAAAAADNRFPSNHRTNPHIHHQHHLQLQQQQLRWFSGFSGRSQQETEDSGQSQKHPWMDQSIDHRPVAPPSKFPDTPPDSGSEPHSPPNDTGPRTSDSVTGNNVARVSSINSMATVTMATVMPPHMFFDPRVTPQHHLHPEHGTPYHLDQHLHALQQQQQQSAPLTSVGSLPLSKGHFGFYGPMEPMKLNSDLSSRLGIVPMSTTVAQHEFQPLYHSAGVHNASNQPPKKRKYSDSVGGGGTLTPGILMNTLGVSNILPVKPEPFTAADLRYGLIADCSEDESFSYDAGGMFVDGVYQVIKWNTYQSTKWAIPLDADRQELIGFNYRVDADKGFNFSPSDDAFVCQKKNHFQITVHASVSALPKYVRLPDTSAIAPVEAFYLHFYGIKMESPTHTINVEQSQSDRSKKLFNPVKIDLCGDQVYKTTIGRLHFSETTCNNMRKKGKPNPDQRYFQLVVALEAHCPGAGGGDDHTVAAHASERIIVRASNPGQFENDSEVIWNKSRAPDAIFHVGRVGINTDTPDEALTVHGNVKVTGHVITPSDVRVKKDISELDTREQLQNISRLKVYKYTFKEDFAELTGMSDDDRLDTGVIAQEVGQVLPDAVKDTGDVLLPGGQTIDNFLVVNKDRIFIENVGAVKELCKVTDKLENRITEIELINRKLSKYSKGRQAGSVTSSGSSVCAGDSLSRSVSSASSAANHTSQKHCTRHRHRHQQQWTRDSAGPGATPTQQLQQEQTARSARLVHIVVIILVVIMSICLLSITVLYVVDRKSMTQASVALDQQWQSTSGPTAPTVPMATISWPASIRPPLIPPQCLENPVECPLRCCQPMPTESPPDDPAHPPPPIFTSPPSTTKKWRKTTKSPNDVDYNEIDVPDKKLFDVPLMSILSTFETVDTGNAASEEQLPQRKNSDNRTPKNTTMRTSNARGRHKRDDDDDDDDGWSPMALVYIKQLNETLLPTSCGGGGDCPRPPPTKTTTGNYSYVVPVSRNFPALSVTVQFVPLATSPDVIVTMCSEMKYSLCSDSNDESSYVTTQVSPYEWDLPVGFYSRLFVKFRLTTTPINNACRLIDTDSGKSFAEYSINFYRKCS